MNNNENLLIQKLFLVALFGLIIVKGDDTKTFKARQTNNFYFS